MIVRHVAWKHEMVRDIMCMASGWTLRDTFIVRNMGHDRLCSWLAKTTLATSASRDEIINSLQEKILLKIYQAMIIYTLQC